MRPINALLLEKDTPITMHQEGQDKEYKIDHILDERTNNSKAEYLV